MSKLLAQGFHTGLSHPTLLGACGRIMQSRLGRRPRTESTIWNMIRGLIVMMATNRRHRVVRQWDGEVRVYPVINTK